MAKFFPLFKNNDDIEEGMNEEFVHVLMQCKRPHIICVYGDARLGKSTKLNQIINGTKSNNYFYLEGPFKTKLEIHTTQTKGCDFYGPIKFKDIAEINEIDKNEFPNRDLLNDELFFVDTEGLKSIGNVTRACVAGILTILQIAAIKVLYIPFLDNEKFLEVAKNSKLSNILRLFKNESETIVLIRDVPLNDCENERQICEEIKQQKEVFQEKIDNYFQKIKAKKAICSILPNYELAKKNQTGYAGAYKQQMRNFIFTFLEQIKNNDDLNGKQLFEIIKELIDIFKQVEDIETMRNTDNALNKILLSTFKQKVEKIYSKIKDKLKLYDKTIISLAYKKDEILQYLINYLKNELKDSWNIYYDSIKSDVDNVLENCQLTLNSDIIKTIQEIKDKISDATYSVINIKENKEINDYFSKINFYEEVNHNDINNIVKKIIDSFISKYKKEFECFEKKYEQDIKNYLKDIINQNLEYRIGSMEKRENYLINIIEIIKVTISNPFVSRILNKNNKLELEKNLDLETLKKEIQLFIAQNEIIASDKEDFQKKLKELFDDIRKIFKDRIDSIEKKETLEIFKRDKLCGRTIADSMYVIKPINCQNKVVQVDNNNLNVWDFKNENKQKFNIVYDSFHRCYSIQNVENGQFLTCDNSNIYLTGKNNVKNQQWHIIIGDDNNYEIIIEVNNNLMEMEGENANNGTRVRCRSKTGKPNQKFNFTATQKTLPPPPPPPDIPQPQTPTQPPVSYFPRPNFHGIYNNQVSIVDALRSIGVDASREYRRRIGERNGIPGTPFSEEYNTIMLNLMKEGRLIIP